MLVGDQNGAETACGNSRGDGLLGCARDDRDADGGFAKLFVFNSQSAGVKGLVNDLAPGINKSANNPFILFMF